MSYFRHHVFFCTNKRDDGVQCCQDRDAQALRDHAKARVKALDIAGKDGVRINAAACMDRCGDGPVIAVYPDGVWYTYVDKDDIDEIIDEHLVKGRIVERLKI